MQQFDFEPIYAALEAKVKACGFKKVSRRVVAVDQVNIGDCPACFISQKNEDPVNLKGQPPKWNLDAELIVVVNAGNSLNVIPSALLNERLAALREAFEVHPVTGVPSGFGDLVSHAWISGSIELFDAGLGSQAVAIVPVSMLTA